MEKLRSRIKMVLAAVILFQGVVFLSGCYTVAGVAEGAATGIVKDTTAAVGMFTWADAWVRKNTW